MKLTKDKNNDYVLYIPSEMIYSHEEHGMMDCGLYQKFDIFALQKIFDDNKLGVEFINKVNDNKFDLGVFKLDIFEHGFARSCKLWIVKEPTKNNDELIRHLVMNYNLALTNFGNLDNKETLKETNKNSLLLCVLSYCMAFGGIWKIYNKTMTYDKNDMKETEMVKMYKWCEKFANDYYGFTI